MVKIIMPSNIPDVERVMDTFIRVKTVEISNPILTRKVGYYIKPLTDVKLMRIFPGVNDHSGSLILCKSRKVVKLPGKGKSISYVFSNEIMKIPRF